MLTYIFQNMDRQHRLGIMRKINERSICEYLAEALGVEVLFYVYEFEYESRCIHYSGMGESTKIIKITEMRL